MFGSSGDDWDPTHAAPPNKVKPAHCPVPQDDVDRGPFIQTHNGVHFHLRDPREADVRLDDIAWALSSLNRYTGHADPRYNVAEHSVHVMRYLAWMGWPAHVQAGGLMHDAAEAYVGDVAKPLKVLLEPAYSQIEHRIAAVIENRFGLRLRADERAAIKHADLVMLATELPVLVNFHDANGGVGEGLPAPWGGGQPMGWSAPTAYYRFLAEAERLGIK